jgi:predicted ferric reductase
VAKAGPRFRPAFDPVCCAGAVVLTDVEVEAAEPAGDAPPPGPRTAMAAWIRQARAPALLTAGALAALWPWYDGPARLHADPLTGTGRVAGLLAGYLIAVQVVTMSRIPAVQRFFGTRALGRWHRIAGTGTILALSVHIGFITAGYAAGLTSLTAQTWWLVTRYEWILAAWAGSLLLFAIGLTSISVIRRRMRYESWYYLHTYAYLAAFLAFLHQVTLGADLTGTARTAWIAFYATAGAAAGYGRIGRPLLLAARHRLRVSRVVTEEPGFTSIYLDGRRLDRLPARAGQFFRFRFLHRSGWWQAHPFSLSAAPDGDRLRITVKASGDYTAALANLPAGTRVLAEGPFGEFTAGHRVNDRVVLIAAGIGITPILALLEDLPAGRATVVYRARQPVLSHELEALAEQRRATLVHLADRAHADRVLSAGGIAELVGDPRRHDFYVCGPPGLVARVRQVLRRLGVPRHCVHTDPFVL